MRWCVVSVLALFISSASDAHHPDREHQRVHPRYDLIGPLGNRLPPSHRRKLNRPTNHGGRIAYWIAPSSQEAMAWHDATHRCLYKNDRPRIVVQYLYPKPWEAMRVGPRAASAELLDGEAAGLYPPDAEVSDQGQLPAQVVGEPIVGDSALIEQ